MRRACVGAREIITAICIAVAFVATCRPAGAQDTRSMTFDQVARLLDARVPHAQILSTAREACIAFRVDEEAARRLAEHGADADFIAALGTACQRIEPAPEAQVEGARQAGPALPVTLPFDPGSAFRQSLVLPGLAQFRMKRPALGLAFFGAWGAVVGIGVASRQASIECLDRVAISCPPDRVRGETVSRPYFAAGAASAIAIALISAFEARAAANRLNRASLNEPGVTQTPGQLRVQPHVGTGSDGATRLGLRVRW